MRWAMRGAAVAGVAAIFGTMAAPAQAECLPWKTAGPVIAKNGLVSAKQVYQDILTRTGGEILHASLCEEDGRFFYKFSVLGPKGDVTNHVVDAKTGQF